MAGTDVRQRLSNGRAGSGARMGVFDSLYVKQNNQKQTRVEKDRSVSD